MADVFDAATGRPLSVKALLQPDVHEQGADKELNPSGKPSHAIVFHLRSFVSTLAIVFPTTLSLQHVFCLRSNVAVKMKKHNLDCAVLTTRMFLSQSSTKQECTALSQEQINCMLSQSAMSEFTWLHSADW